VNNPSGHEYSIYESSSCTKNGFTVNRILPRVPNQEKAMKVTEHRSDILPKAIFYFCIFVFLLTCNLFISNSYVTIFEYKIYTLTATGVMGLLAVFLYGLYATLNGRPELNAFQHITFSLILTVAALTLYMLTIAILRGVTQMV
jgi:hypothetical protein